MINFLETEKLNSKGKRHLTILSLLGGLILLLVAYNIYDILVNHDAFINISAAITIAAPIIYYGALRAIVEVGDTQIDHAIQLNV